MIPFGERKDNLREKAIEYMKLQVSLKKFLIYNELYDYFFHNEDVKFCQAISVENIEGKLCVNHSNERTTEWTEIEEVSTDLICYIADQMHFKSLRELKDTV